MKFKLGDKVKDKFKRPKGHEDESVCRGTVIMFVGGQVTVLWEVADASGDFVRTVSEHILEKL